MPDEVEESSTRANVSIAGESGSSLACRRSTTATDDENNQRNEMDVDYVPNKPPDVRIEGERGQDGHNELVEAERQSALTHGRSTTHTDKVNQRPLPLDGDVPGP